MRIGTRRTALLLAISFSLLTLGNNGCENVIVVRDGESIQAAVDAANPGDTIVVANGFYTASGVDAVVEGPLWQPWRDLGDFGAVVTLRGEDAPSGVE